LPMTGKKTDAQNNPENENSLVNEMDEKDSQETPKVVEDDPVKELERKLEAKEKEAADNYDRLLRVSAEFENYKKRSKREFDDFKKYAIESLVSALLPAVDNLQRAVSSYADNRQKKDPLSEGVSLTLVDILKVLEKFNITPIESLGQPFNPNFHEAMMQEHSDTHPDNTVIQELQRGYRIHDRLLRPSLVVVSKKKQ
jgi:molecular chaperone GrpE